VSLLDDLGGVNGSWGALPQPDYDDAGALYYVVAVVFLYGFSIILMIGSLIRKSHSDRGMNVYMQGLDKVRRLERRREKFKVRMFMQSRRMQRILSRDSSGYSRESSFRGHSQRDRALSDSHLSWPSPDPQVTDPLIAPSDAVDTSPSPSLSSSSARTTTETTPKPADVCIEMSGSSSAFNYDAATSSSAPLLAEELTRAQLATLLEEDEDATLL
jgi:hypothetical protein